MRLLIILIFISNFLFGIEQEIPKNVMVFMEKEYEGNSNKEFRWRLEVYNKNGERVKFLYDFDTEFNLVENDNYEANESDVNEVYDKNGKLIEIKEVYDENHYIITNFKEYKKNGYRVEEEIITNYSEGKHVGYGSWYIIRIYNKKGLLIKEEYNGNRISYMYYKYDENNILKEELFVHPDGTLISYYIYEDGLLKEIKEYRYELNMMIESDYELPNIPKSEKKKLWIRKNYDYIFWNDLSFVNLEKIFSLKIKLKDKIAFFEDLQISIILKEKPKIYTDSQYVLLLNNYAYYLSETDRYEEAMPILEKVINLSQNRAVAYLNLGDCYDKLYKNSKDEKDKEKSIKNYKKYISLLKKDAKIPENVKKIMGIK